jgi:putative transposase
MTNHVHLVLEPTEKGGNLADIMKGINLSYAQYFKNKYKHTGHFWQDRYKSIIISKDNYLLACGSYVELNPVRARIVKDPKDYKRSSYNAYAYGKNDSIVDEHPIYNELSKNETGRRQKYREFVKGMLKEKKAMKGEMDRRVIYGSEEFTERTKGKYEIEEVIKPKGRPKKDVEGDK